MKRILTTAVMAAALMFSGAVAAKKAGSGDEMKMAKAKTSGVPEIGKPAPGFNLPGHDGEKHSLADYKGKMVVLEWLNEGCPFVKHHYDNDNMQGLQAKYGKRDDIAWLSIVSSAPGKQGYYESNEDCEAFIKDKKAAMDVVLMDPDGKVGRLYGARTTPHMFVLDAEHRVRYMGAIDDNPKVWGTDPAEQNNYVSAALEALLEGKDPEVTVTKPYGCSVKYSKK